MSVADRRPTPEQAAIMLKVGAAALAEVGYAAWPEDGNVLLRYAGMPAEVAYKAYRLAYQAIGMEPHCATIDEWIGNDPRRQRMVRLQALA